MLVSGGFGVEATAAAAAVVEGKVGGRVDDAEVLLMFSRFPQLIKQVHTVLQDLR